MTTFSAVLTLRPPRMHERLWYQRLKRPVPPAVTAPRGSEYWARLAPYRMRFFHHRYASKHGYFWIPCPLCGQHFGGHESGADIPDPTDAHQRRYLVVCSRCTRAGRSTP